MRSTPTLRGWYLPTLLRTAAVYWLRIYPQVRHELSFWIEHARSIPNPVLRACAIEKLTVERLNPEAAAFFAVLAPREQRCRVVRLIVAYQVVYDYLDAVNEQAGDTALRNGLRLHRALVDAVQPAPAACDYYTHNRQRDDGGYAQLLVDACKETLRTLRLTNSELQRLTVAAERCGQAQSHNHAIQNEGEQRLADWSIAQAPQRGYLWWELAAAGISCLAIHALFAIAADPKSTVRDATLTDEAYFPGVCAISALLDSLIDYYTDIGTTNHSFAARYNDNTLAATRFATITSETAVKLRELRNHRSHSIILTGIAAFYLSSPAARREFPAPVARSVIGCLGPLATPMLAVMRLRRHAHSTREK
jgi:tetraprenyl-beta-curcumene synthase